MRLLFLLLLFSTGCFAQSKSISFEKKVKDPVIISSGDTLKIDQTITVGMGTTPNGGFKYVQLLNSFNEPIQPADSRAAMKKQTIKFFKIQDGTTYVFTKYFVINIEAALQSKEALLR